MKKKIKELGPIMSPSGESGHYIKRCLERTDIGALIPYSRKQIKELIAAGEVDIRKAGKRKKEIYFKNGVRMVVSSDLKTFITYMD